MPKRNKKESQFKNNDAQDNPIGLTSAFEPIDDDDEIIFSGKHARHARYDTTDDDDESSTDDETNAVSNDRANEDDTTSASEDSVDRETNEPTKAQADDDTQTSDTDETLNKEEKPNEMPEYVRRSRRTRRILIVVIIILIVAIAAGAFLVYNLIESSQEEAEKLVQESDETTIIDNGESTEDLPTTTVKTTSAPNLVDLLGLTLDEAIAELGNGAEVTTTQEVNEEDSSVKSQSRVVLTSEVTTDMGSNIPTVYLDFDEGNKVIQAGYSVATAALGFGSMSFADAIDNEHIIETTLAEAGVDIESSDITLPEDKSKYSTYDNNDVLTKEYYSFSGNVSIDNKTCEWSAVLSYDYASANATGNLSDTIRVIYVYIGD